MFSNWLSNEFLKCLSPSAVTKKPTASPTASSKVVVRRDENGCIKDFKDLIKSSWPNGMTFWIRTGTEIL